MTPPAPPGYAWQASLFADWDPVPGWRLLLAANLLALLPLGAAALPFLPGAIGQIVLLALLLNTAESGGA